MLLKGLPNAIIVATQRYIAITFSRYYLTGELIDYLIAVLDKDNDDTIDLIAGYIIYSIEMYYIYKIDKGSKLDEFLTLGFKQYHLQRLTNTKQKLDNSNAEDRQLAQDYQQQERLEGLEYLLINDEFQQIYQILDIQLQDHQRQVFETIAISIDKFLYIARTGASKLVVFALLAYTILSTIIVVIQLIYGLQREILAYLRSYSIKGMIFLLEEGEDKEVVPLVVLVTPEAIAYSIQQAFLNRYYIRYSIDQAMLNKAYEILINSNFQP